MSRSNSRTRQKKHREQKKREAMRAKLVSPYRQAARSGRVTACYISRFDEDTGADVIYLLRESPGGFVVASFLIDRWCIGLKDAWGRLDITSTEFHELLERQKKRMEGELERIAPETARKLIAGAVRFSRENGFKLPPRYERWTDLLGGVGDWQNADLSAFRKDGKLCFIGEEEDLRKRLIGTTVEKFLSRPDVDFIMRAPAGYFAHSDDDEYEYDDEYDVEDEYDDEYDDEHEGELDDEPVTEEEMERERGAMRRVAAFARRFVDQMEDDFRRWCIEQRRIPHPHTREAIQVVVSAVLASLANADASTAFVKVMQAKDELSIAVGKEIMSEEEIEGMKQALPDVFEYMANYVDPAKFFESFDFDEQGDDEAEIAEENPPSAKSEAASPPRWRWPWQFFTRSE